MVIANGREVKSVVYGDDVFSKNIEPDKFKVQKKILADNVLNANTPDFSQVATTAEGLFKAQDNDGDTYYYRGAVTNNYVQFAGFWWRIIRVNGDGSLRIIYDGTSAHANGEVSTDREIVKRRYNIAVGSVLRGNAFLGYMHNLGGLNTYELTHKNYRSSETKLILEEWARDYLLDYIDYIDFNATFWNDREAYSGKGYSAEKTTYTGYNRLANKKQPILICNNQNDLFSSFNSSKGNKCLGIPIGLIAADEVQMSGMTYSAANKTLWLFSGAFWTMTPSHYNPDALNTNIMNCIGVQNTGKMVSIGIEQEFGIRPVINLRGDLELEGNGTIANPYKIKGVK